ncbi:YifB family Mg chelatase-like AAA ATPase [Clostridium thermarum]|uniref:YifB family Mg chelatase-like AAA ATPase n=1 Tax=Clostridium thermarum TaxID=1716543 RepID=UPI00111D9B1A|nr:YifB family Mg chelatase-like AAA ATPase [Clostridium thermarum]
MAISIYSSTYNGLQGIIINVEVEISRGLPAFNIVGLADTAVRESKERVRSAIINSGYDFPLGKITVNLAPADIKKVGSLLDLPIAIGILAATDQINSEGINNFIIVGELSLNGDITSIRGALPIVIEGIRNNLVKFIVPTDNALECSLIEKAEIYPFDTLNQVTSYLKHRDMLPYKNNCVNRKKESNMDFSEVVGQNATKRALEIACAGGHNIIMFGPPGCGKSMLASRIPTILPSLTYEESLDVTKIYSITGKLHPNEGLIVNRPYRAPHHTATKTALIGGGSQLMPGEITLSHHGILFLDELLEFNKTVLEVLREPLESKQITISRCTGSVVYPADFMLVASLNPCPCGYYLSKVRECTCSDHERIKYLNKLSGPFLDRIDMFSFAYAHNFNEMTSTTKEESSESIRKRVEAARQIQRKRFAMEKLNCNGDMSGRHIRKYCTIDSAAEDILNRYFNKFPFSMRIYNKVLKISRTIADLENSKDITSSHVIEAISYRQFIKGDVI